MPVVDPAPRARALCVPAAITEQLARTEQLHAAVCADRDIEALHQYRVALRRARSLATLLPAHNSEVATVRSQQQRILRQLMDATLDLRDWDLLLADSDEQFAYATPAHWHPWPELRALMMSRRAQRMQSLTSWLQGDHYRRLRAQLGDLIQQETELNGGALRIAQLQPVLSQQHHQVQSRLPPDPALTTEKQLHQLRIAIKKLRYLLEFAQGIDDSPLLLPLAKHCKALQSQLGEFNDSCVRLQLLVNLPQQQPGLAAPVMALLGVLCQHYAEQRQQRRLALAGPLRRFAKPRLQRTLRLWLTG